MELCEAIGNDRMIEASASNWVQMWLNHSKTYPKLFLQVEPFIVNLPTSNLAEKGFSIALHSFTKHRRRLTLDNNSKMSLRLTHVQPRISALVTQKQPQGSHYKVFCFLCLFTL